MDTSDTFEAVRDRHVYLSRCSRDNLDQKECKRNDAKAHTWKEQPGGEYWRGPGQVDT
jgi:hypothetical protein